MQKKQEESGSTIEGESLPSMSQRKNESGNNISFKSQLAEKDLIIHSLTEELMQIKSSTAWKIIQLLWRIRVIIIPHDSKREHAAYMLMERFRVFRSNRFKIQFRFSGKKIGIKKYGTIRDLVRNWDDEEYFKLILESVTQPYIEGIKMPGFPSDEFQKNSVGSTRDTALREGYNFYKHVKEYCRLLGTPLNAKTSILDFGCGWGRISRFFFKDVESKNFYGVDVDPNMINFCDSEMTCGNYTIVNPEPPTKFKSDSLDVIFAYSVFSHLAEDVALKWIEEFSRILRPNGILLATTQGRFFLDFCQSLHERTEELEFAWFKGLAQSFLPIEKAKEDYDNGKFLYSPTGGGAFRDRSFYGEAIIPRKYIEQKYAPILIFRDFIHDPDVLPQALFVMQKSS